MTKLFLLTSTAFAILLIAFSSCGKGVIDDGKSADASSGEPNSVPTTTTPGGGTITPTPGIPGDGCPADQLAFFSFAQSSPAQETIDLNLSGSSSILSVMVKGQDVSYTFDPDAGAITLSDAGQPGELIQIEACLPSPIGKSPGKPNGKPTPCPSESVSPSPTPSPSQCTGPTCAGGGPIGT
jgi:hypothetical protein